jgi:hypothetical protein
MSNGYPPFFFNTYLPLLAYNKADIGLDLIASVNNETASSKFPENNHFKNI